MQLQDSTGKSVGTPVILDNAGKGVLALPVDSSGDSLKAVQASGTATSPASDAVSIPVLKPIVGAIDPQTGSLIVEGKPGATVQLKDSTGASVGTPVTLGNDGKGILQIPTTLSDQAVTVTQTVNNSESPATAPLTVPLLKPLLEIPDAATGTVAVTGKPGASVQLQDSTGKTVGTPVILDNAGKGVLTLSVDTSGDSLKAVQTSGTTTSPASDAVSIPVLKPIVGAIDPQTGSLIVEGKPGASVQLKDSTGTPVGTPVALDTDGKGTLQIPSTLSGLPVTVTQTVGNNESPATAPLTVPLLKPELGTVNLSTNELPVTGKPGASVQLRDGTGKAVGAPVTLDAEGKNAFLLSPDMSGQALVAVQKFNDLESLPSDSVSVPLLKPVLTLDAASGELSVTGKPNGTVQLLDKNNSPVGNPVQLDAQGQTVIKLPQALGGEPIGVFAQEAGTTSATSTLDVPLLAPVFGVVNATTGQVTVEGKPNGVVQIKSPDGTFIRVPLDDTGKGTALLPSGVSGDDLQATVVLGSLESAPTTLSVPVLAPRDAVINDTGSAVTVKGNPGEVIKVKDASGKELGSGVVSMTGSVEIPLSTPQKTGAILSVTAYNETQASATVTVVAPFIDADLPLPPTDLNINPAGTRVLGKVKPGETVKIVNLDTQQELGTFTAGPDGLFSANIAAQKGGERLAISAVKTETNADGTIKSTKVSEPALLLVPLSAEDTPAKPFDVSVDATGTQVQGKGAPNTIVLIKAADDKTVIAKGIVGPDGTFNVAIPVQPGGQLLNVALQNNDKQSASEAVMTPHIASNTPTGVEIDEAGTQVTGKGNKGETIRVKDAQGNEIGSGVVQQDGTFVVTIPKQPTDTSLAVTAQGQGVESAPAYVKTPAIEVDRLPQPEAHLDAAGTQITGKTLPGASVSVKDTTGQLLAGPIVAGDDGSFAATIAKQPAGSTVAVVSELAGKQSLPTELIAPQVEGERPPAPLSAMISADGKFVSGKAAPNTKVVVKNAAGQTLGEQPVDADGNYVVPIKVQVGGAVLGVTSASLDNQLTSTGSVPVTAPYQLVAEHHEVEVSQFIDPNINALNESRYNKFESVLISSWFPGNQYQYYDFSINANERAEVRVVSNQGVLSLNAFTTNGVYLEKNVNGEWLRVQSNESGGLLNISVISVLAGSSGISLKFETPGEYRVVMKSVDVAFISTVEYHSTIVKESFVGGFANSLISSDLVLPTGAKLLKVNDTLIAEQVRSVVQGKYGQLSISNDGKATYQQDRNATPADQTETFSYEARAADGAILNATFNIGIKAYSVSGDLVLPDEASIVSVEGKSVSSTNQETITGKYGDLKVAANGDYTYTPKLSLTGLNETETFTYQVKHTNGETVTSTLEVKIADSRLVAELNEVPTGAAPAPDLAARLAQPETPVDTDAESNTALPSFNLGQGPNLDLNKLVSLQPKDDPTKPALTLTLNDIMQADGSVSKSASASTLDLPDSWKPDGTKAPLDGHEYVHYIDETTKKDLWVESGISIV
ncbi:hypothetical protein DK871_26620 [Pseudomonas sp. L13]|nr:hypothetical protein [Pseudomonas sp. L13]